MGDGAGDDRGDAGTDTGVERIAAAFAAAPGRAALMPYLMGGFPDLEGSIAIGEACADAGADLVELGVPFSDPLADGPVIHAAGTRALAAGATLHGVSRSPRGSPSACPVVLMCYANPLLARGAERFAGELAAAGVSGLIVPDLPLEEAGAVRAALRRRRPRARPAGRADHAGRAAGRDRRAGARVRLHGLGHRHDRRARRRGRRRWRPCSPARRRTARCRSRVGFGISTPEQAAAAADAGADGVIVGSRLVRAATEAVDAGERPRRGGRRGWSRRSPRRSSARLRAVMGLLLTLIAGLVVWVVLWALGVEGVRRVHDHRADASSSARRPRIVVAASPGQPPGQADGPPHLPVPGDARDAAHRRFAASPDLPCFAATLLHCRNGRA